VYILYCIKVCDGFFLLPSKICCETLFVFFTFHTEKYCWLSFISLLLKYTQSTHVLVLISLEQPSMYCIIYYSAFESCWEANMKNWTADPGGPVQNIFFPIVHNFKLSVPIVQQAGLTGRQGPQSLCVSGPLPAPKAGGGGYTLAGPWRGWGINILEDARQRIGLLQYNLSTFWANAEWFATLLLCKQTLRCSDYAVERFAKNHSMLAHFQLPFVCKWHFLLCG
jgi:hypothetical protein